MRLLQSLASPDLHMREKKFPQVRQMFDSNKSNIFQAHGGLEIVHISISQGGELL